MNQYKIRRLALVCAIAVGMIPVVKATEVEASSRHIGKHHKLKNLNAFASVEAQPVGWSRFASKDACPGNARSFDCKVWPPAINDDPDRRNSGGGGGE